MKGKAVAKAVCGLLSSLLSCFPLPPETESEPARVLQRDGELPALGLQQGYCNPRYKATSALPTQLLNWDGEEIDTSPNGSKAAGQKIA